MWSFGTTMTMPKDSESASKTPSQPPSQPPRLDQMSQTAAHASSSPPLSETRPSILSQRSLRQLGIFFAGAGFLSLATLITRRSIAKKMRATVPRFYTQSNRPVNTIGSDSSLIALEALNLATLHVVGFAIMMTGGVSWALDLSNIDDLRNRARRHLGPSGARTDEEAEREVEEWVAKILLRSENQQEAAAATTTTPPTTKGKAD